MTKKGFTTETSKSIENVARKQTRIPADRIHLARIFHWSTIEHHLTHRLHNVWILFIVYLSTKYAKIFLTASNSTGKNVKEEVNLGVSREFLETRVRVQRAPPCWNYSKYPYPFYPQVKYKWQQHESLKSFLVNIYTCYHCFMMKLLHIVLMVSGSYWEDKRIPCSFREIHQILVALTCHFEAGFGFNIGGQYLCYNTRHWV